MFHGRVNCLYFRSTYKKYFQLSCFLRTYYYHYYYYFVSMVLFSFHTKTNHSIPIEMCWVKEMWFVRLRDTINDRYRPINLEWEKNQKPNDNNNNNIIDDDDDDNEVRKENCKIALFQWSLFISSQIRCSIAILFNFNRLLISLLHFERTLWNLNTFVVNVYVCVFFAAVFLILFYLSSIFLL